MRILKFKAWDKTHSEWYMDGTTFDLNYSARYGDFYFDNDNPHNMRDVKLEWVQFTGLKDKNGKEIYEGNIVRFTRSVRVGTQRTRGSRRGSYDSFPINESRELRGVVEIGVFKHPFIETVMPHVKVNNSTEYDSYFFCEGKAKDRPQRVTQNLSEVLKVDGEYEVIGNIYENSELLKD